LLKHKKDAEATMTATNELDAALCQEELPDEFSRLASSSSPRERPNVAWMVSGIVPAACPAGRGDLPAHAEAASGRAGMVARPGPRQSAQSLRIDNHFRLVCLMIEDSFNLTGGESVAVLFHPSTVPVMDVFRSIDSLDDQYDLTLLDGPEQALAAYVQSGSTKGIVSDALLLAFALTRQRGKAFDHRPVGSRQGSLEEYCLMVVIGAARRPGSEVAREASALLGISPLPLDLLSALGGELARQMDLGSIVFPVPEPGEFRAVVGIDDGQFKAIVEAFDRPGRHFSL